MTTQIPPAARAATVLAATAVAAGLLAVPAPAAAQGPAPLPLQSPSERLVEDTNRTLMLDRRLDAIDQRQRFQEGQLRERLHRLEMFPRVAPTPPPIVAD